MGTLGWNASPNFTLSGSSYTRFYCEDYNQTGNLAFCHILPKSGHSLKQNLLGKNCFIHNAKTICFCNYKAVKRVPKTM
jgi:hypothetical protein